MRAHQFVLKEYSRDVTAQKLGSALLAKFQKEPQTWQARIVGNPTDDITKLDRLLGHVEHADPTKNKQYVPWIIRNYINNPSLKFEDAISKVSEPLLKFFKLVSKKQIPAPNNDIGRIRDLATLVQVVDQFPDVEEKDKNAERGQAKPYYEDADIRVIIPQDVTAACYYGQGTKWCTAAQNNNMFDRYNKQGEMYIIIPKKPVHTGEKYQFHFQSKQFMDEKDHRVSLTELRARWPQLADIFAEQAAANHVMALDKDITNLPAMMQQALPLFTKTLATLIQHDGRLRAREIYKELGAVVKAFRGMEEIKEIAEDMFEEKARDLAIAAADIIRDDPDAANDEDLLYDALSNHLTDIVRESELWLFCVEWLEELEDEEAEFDVAMCIEGEINAMMQKLIPQAFAEAINTVKRSQ